MIFFGKGQRETLGNVFLKKLGSGLVVQRFRYHFFAQLLALYHLDMVPWGQGFEGVSTGVMDFHVFGGRYWGVGGQK